MNLGLNNTALGSFSVEEAFRKFNINIGNEDIKDIDTLQLIETECLFLNRKTGTMYHSIITNNIQNYYSCKEKYIKTRISYDNGFIRETYKNMATGFIPIDYLAIVNGQYILIFGKEYAEENSKSLISANHGNRFSIELLKRFDNNLETFDFNIDYEQYEQVFASITSESLDELFEYKNLGDSRKSNNERVLSNQYNYLLRNNLIRIIQDRELKDIYSYSSVCMERSLYDNLALAKNYEPYNLRISSFEDNNPIDANVLSCLSYSATLGPKESSLTHLFFILKYKEGYKIIHRFTTHERELIFENKDSQEEYFIPTGNESTINDSDILMLMEKIKVIAKNEALSYLICNDLEEYRLNLKYKVQKTISIMEPLNPMFYARQTFDGIIEEGKEGNIYLVSTVLKRVEELKTEIDFRMAKVFTR